MNWELLKSIDFSKVFAQERASFKKLSRIESQKRFLDDVFQKCTKLDVNLSLDSSPPALLFYKSMDRPDYDLLLNKVVGLRNYPIVNLSYKSSNLNVELIRFIRNNYRHADSIEEGNPYLNQALKIKLLSYCYMLEKLYRHTKKAVFFSDMQGPENFFCQAFKISKVPTATMQHGLYVEYFNEDNINVINYKNHVADYFLAWGNCTANLIHKYRPDSKVVVVGKPTLNPISFRASAGNPGYILIVSDQRMFDKQNINMISIVLSAMRKDLKRIVVKLHPSNERAMYQKIFPKLNIVEEIPKDIDLVIGHTTSLLYEMFSQGVNVLRYSSEVESIHFPPEAEFDSAERLSEARTWLSSNDANKGSEFYIKYLGKDSLDHYKNFLDYFDGI